MTATDTTTAAARFLADAGRARAPMKGITLDGYNRYVIADPITGKERHWIRATTWAGAIKDSFGLARWSRRMEAHGLAMRRDLIATVAEDVSTHGAGQFDHRDCSKLDEAISHAQEHAGSTVAATLGTVMHRFTEMVDDTGDWPEVVPAPLDRDLDAYRVTMAHHHFEPVAIERIVCVPDLGVAGTLDRILSRGGAYIGDLKTGKDLGYAWCEIAVQLALYAHATYMWDADHWDPMPPVDQQRAVVMHLPIGQARCDLYWVDIAAGWETANQLCGPVRRWRNRSDLATKIDGQALPSPPPEGEPERAAASAGPAPDDATGAASSPSVGRSGQDDELRYTRSAWISSRLSALADDQRARALVGLRWPPATSPHPPWSNETIDQLAAVLDDVEDEVGAGISPPDPRGARDRAPEAPESPPERRSELPGWDMHEDGVIAPDDDVAGLSAALAFLDDDQQERLLRWAQDAARAGRPFAGRRPTVRMLTCARAAFQLAAHGGDDAAVRRTLAAVVPDFDDLEDPWSIGVVLGSLDAARAAAVADRFNP